MFDKQPVKDLALHEHALSNDIQGSLHCDICDMFQNAW